MKKAKKYFWARLIGVGLVFPVFFVLTVPSANGKEPIRLLNFSGNVEIQTSGKSTWERVASTVTLNPGDILRTGVRSQAEVGFNGGIIRMYENTLLRLPKIGMEVSDESSIKSQQAFLTYGKAIFNIVKRSFANSFEVVTPSLIAGVKGTVFRVVEEPEEQTVSVFEGVVQVSRSGKTGETVELVEKQMARLTDGSLMGPLPVDPRDQGWNEWQSFPVQETAGGAPLNSIPERNQETLDNGDMSFESAEKGLNETEEMFAQRIADRRNERLGDLLENSNDFRREVQTGAIRYPSLTVEKVEEAVQTILSSADRTLGTDTGSIVNVDSTITGLTGSVDNTVTGLTGTVDNTITGVTGTLDNTITGVTGTVEDTTSGLPETLDSTILDLPSLLP
ncbi:MAG TPA: FecR domain-containing protein [Nitrospiria bacterium]